eukprot:13610636-Ditylum_brightwellii.AAC.1
MKEDITAKEHIDDNSSSEENNGSNNESDDKTIDSLCEASNYEADVMTDNNIELDIPSTNAGKFAYKISKEEGSKQLNVSGELVQYYFKKVCRSNIQKQ